MIDEAHKAAPQTLEWVAVPSHIAEGFAEVRHKDGWLVCEVPADSYAKLIAAAPAMLDALKAMLQHTGVRDAAAEDKDIDDHDAERLARAAIIKAGA